MKENTYYVETWLQTELQIHYNDTARNMSVDDVHNWTVTFSLSTFVSIPELIIIKPHNSGYL